MASFLCWLSHQSQAQGDQLLYADGKAQLKKNKYSEKRTSLFCVVRMRHWQVHAINNLSDYKLSGFCHTVSAKQMRSIKDHIAMMFLL